MRKHHPDNERIKRRFADYLKHAKQLSEDSIDQALAAIADFETISGYRDFKKHRIELAQKYKRDLEDRHNPKTGKPLAKSTVTSRLMALKAFFEWLAGQSGYRSKLTYSDAQYFRPSANDQRIARAARPKRVPTLDQMRKVIEAMPSETDVEKRDRALIAFVVLTGARDNAVASMSLKHVDLDQRLVFQDARQVRTKYRKTFTTWFFPVGDDIEQIVIDWVNFLMTEKRFRPEDPLFPPTPSIVGTSGEFEVGEFGRTHWANADPIRRIFKAAFEAVGLPYSNPHCIRDMIVQLGQTSDLSIEEFKAWSQNIGHENAMITLTNYGTVTDHRQAEIMAKLRTTRDNSVPKTDHLERKLLEVLERLQRAKTG